MNAENCRIIVVLFQILFSLFFRIVGFIFGTSLSILGGFVLIEIFLGLYRTDGVASTTIYTFWSISILMLGVVFLYFTFHRKKENRR